MPPKATASSVALPPAVVPVATNAAATRRKRPMELGDVTGLDAVPFDSDLLAVPELSEARILDLVAALQDIESGPVAQPWFTRAHIIAAPSDASPVVSSEPSLAELLAVDRRTPSPKRQRGQPSQPFSTTPRQELALTLKAMYRKIHGTGLRSHEELAAHLGVNLGDVIHSEKVAAICGVGIADNKEGAIPKEPDTSAGASRTIGGAFAKATSMLPPLAVLALRWWTSDDRSMYRFFMTRYASNDASRTDLAGAELIPVVDAFGHRSSSRDATKASLRVALVNRLRELVRESYEADSAMSAGAFAMHPEIMAAVGLRTRGPFMKWCGTIALLIASIDAMFRSLEAQNAALAAAEKGPSTALPPVVASPTSPLPPRKSNKTKPPPKAAATENKKARRTSVRPSSASSAPLPPEGWKADSPTVFLIHTVVYPDGEACRAVMEKIVATLEPGQKLDVPMLSLFQVSTVEPTLPELTKVDGFVDPSPDVTENGMPRTKAERAAVLCDGYIRTSSAARRVHIVIASPPDAFLPLAPFCFGKEGTTQKRMESFMGLSEDVSFRESAPSSRGSSARLTSSSSRAPSSMPRPFSAQPASPLQPSTPSPLSPSTFPPHSTMKFVSCNIQTNSLHFIYSGRRPTTDAGNLKLFLESVLDDAVKADEVANTIHNRLALRFIRPHHCRRHTSQRYAMFCHDCRAFICRACLSERHAHHATAPHSAFCADEANRLLPKRNVVLARLALLKDLKHRVGEESARTHALVDTAVDDVISRLGDRRRALHEDCAARAAEYTQRVADELSAWRRESQALKEALRVISEARAGRVNTVPAMVKRRPVGIFNSLRLQLPSKQIRQLAQVLTWSNPSQYLTSEIYPPVEGEEVALMSRIADRPAAQVVRTPQV